jgi:hypothetical protein
MSDARDMMISYARAEARKFAERLATKLQGYFSVWFDTEDIFGGAEWLESIEKAIAGCKVFLAVRSPAGSASRWVASERLFAINNQKPIVPLLAIRCPGEDLELITHQSVNFIEDFEGGFQQLLGLVRQLVSGATPSRRERHVLEQGYVGRVLLQHSIWQDLYTPMACVAQLQRNSVAAPPRMKTAPTSIDPIFHRFIRERSGDQVSRLQTVVRDYADLLPAVDELKQLLILGDPGTTRPSDFPRACTPEVRS